MGLLIQVVMLFFTIIWKIAWFTGLWLLYPLIFFMIWLDEKMGWSVELSDRIAFVTVIAYGVFVIYTTTNNILRLILQDSQFSLIKGIWSFITRSRGKHKDKGFKADTKVMQTSKRQLTGFFFGITKGKYITMKENEDGHILIVGGAGSGKSSCIAIPTLKTWQGRVLAIDIKGELSSKSQRRGKVFCPSNPNSYGYDPFYILNKSNNKVQDSRDIALSLIPLKEDIKDPFWIQSAQNLFTAFILHFSEEGKGFIDSMIAIQSQPVELLVNIVSQSTSFEAKMFINQFIGMDKKTLTGIYTELSNKIMVFATDSDLRRTLTKDIIITPNDLESGEDIFLQIDESKIEQWKGLLSLIIAQFLKHFEKREEKSSNEPILFLLDEFPRLGRIEGITNGLATLRSKKIHIALLVQSLAQLDVIYGKGNRKIIADNATYTAILKATDTETQEYFSKRVGTHERAKISRNANYEQYTQLGKGTSISRTTEEKRIIKPEEFAYLKDIVLLSPTGYLRIEKAPYYEDGTIQRQMQEQFVVEEFTGVDEGDTWL